MSSQDKLSSVKLASSGLDEKDRKTLRIQTLSAQAVVRLSSSFKPYPALRIPYFDLTGKPDGFYRLRYLGEMNGFDALRSKALRYVQPPDTPPGVYLPPYGNWEGLSKDTGRALFITEGELKAAAACKRALPTIGLGGVWSWKSVKRSIGFHPVLEGFTWKGRAVYLVFDSDFSVNPDVMKALVALAKELGARGAQPYLVALPDLPKLLEQGKKTGLDDYLLEKPLEDFNTLVSEAEPFNQSEELWQLNSEVVYIKNPGLVIALAEGRKMAPSAFKEHAYANRHYYEMSFNAKGEQKQVKKPLAPAWLSWECRAELEKITYAPGSPRVVDGAYNYWAGWSCEPKKGEVALWHKLLAHLFSREGPESLRWFEQWLAWPLQNPGGKLYSAAVLWGQKHGTGKSLVGYTMGKIYGRNFTEISDENLEGSFNEWSENKQFIMGDDVTGSEYKKALMEKLKFMITRQTLRVNAKYMPTYEVPDCINWYFTSNHPDAFLIEDTDRRYFVVQVPGETLGQAFYDSYDQALHRGPLAPAIFDHLLRVDLTGFNPRAPAMNTASKQAMILDTKSDASMWVASLRETPESVLRLGESPLKSDLWTTGQLLSLYDPQGSKRISANGLGRELKRAGFPQVNRGAVVMTAKGPQRLYAVRSIERWIRAAPKEISAHYNQHFAKAAERKKTGDKL